MLVRLLLICAVLSTLVGCGNSGASVPGKYQYFIDASTASAEDAAGLIGLQQTLQQMRVQLNEGGSAILTKNKTVVPGQWSMEGSHIYIRPKEGDMLEGTYEADKSRIFMDPLGDFAQQPKIKIYLVKER